MLDHLGIKVADFERDIQLARLAHLHGDVVVLHALEAGEGDRDWHAGPSDG